MSIYFTIRHQVTDLQQRGHGSVFNTITRDTFKAIQVSSPPVRLTLVFDDMVESLMEKILTNLHESCTLASLRDTLLPKLISGELRVPDAENMLEDVI